MDFDKFWFSFLVVLAALPGVTLLLRGSVWGSDSFAYLSVSCGNYSVVPFIHSPQAFVWFLQNVISCNLWVLAVVMFVLYFGALLGIYFFGKRFFDFHQAKRLPIYVACLTPLFFVEALRFEQEFFGWCLAFVALGLFCLWKNKSNPICLFFSALLACFSLLFWFPSIFILALVVFCLDIPVLWKYVVLCIGGLVVLSQRLGYVVSSFTQGIGINAVAEEIPLVGLVFVLHLLHFYKKIPQPITFYGWFLLLLGALKSKYMFLAVVPLIMGLMVKEKESGLSIPKMGIKRIPTLAFCLLLVSGWFVMGLSMYPTQNDLIEMKSAIKLANDNNISLYNTWGDGWMLVSLGYDTNFKISPPQPDWNSLPRPFVAWSIENISGCERTNKRTQLCN